MDFREANEFLNRLGDFFAYNQDEINKMSNDKFLVLVNVYINKNQPSGATNNQRSALTYWKSVL